MHLSTLSRKLNLWASLTHRFGEIGLSSFGRCIIHGPSAIRNRHVSVSTKSETATTVDHLTHNRWDNNMIG